MSATLIFRQVMRVALSVSLPRKWFITRGTRHSNHVFLTFDDGPHPTYTPQLLDLLKELRVRATFFVIGRNVEEHPAIARRIVAEGHELGHHSYYHLHPSTVSWRQLMEETYRTTELINRLTGRSSELFRPPHGKLTVLKLLGLRQARQSIILWNVDPKDFACGSSEQILRWFQSRPLCAGDIVLMHDNSPRAADVLPELVESTRKNNLEFQTITAAVLSRQRR